MIYAVSNIAWPPAERLRAYEVLRAADFAGLEIAPGLFFAEADDPFAPPPSLRKSAMREIEEAGLMLVSMQSLLFGVRGAALFEDDEAHGRLMQGMRRTIRLAGSIGVPNLVFGSPQQRRIPEAMSAEAAQERAVTSFAVLGDLAVEEGTAISIEANPEIYGTNFMNRGAEALDFARAMNHPGIRWILDVGAMHCNREFGQIGGLVKEAGALLRHVHISEPSLAPAPRDAAQAAEVIAALEQAGYEGAVSIEMKAAEIDPVAIMAAAVSRLAEARAIS